MNDAWPAHDARRGHLGSRIACVLIVLLAVYNANFREIGFADTIPATLLPASVVQEQNLDLDEFDDLFAAEPTLRSSARWLGSMQVRDGHLVSSYPVGASLLASPVYALLMATVPLRDWRDYRRAAKLAASLLVALSAVFVFLAARRLTSETGALVVAFSYGLATDAWTVASQALWQHGPGMFCLAIALYVLLRSDQPRAWEASMAGLALGFAVVCRPINVVPTLMLGFYVLRWHRRQVPAFAAPLALCGAWLLWYNLSTFGEPLGGYRAVFTGAALAQFGVTPEAAFSNPLLPGLAGVLVSPSKGLLVFSPFLAFAVVGMVTVWQRATSFPLGRYLTVWVVAGVLLQAKYIYWWGGGSYGPRMLCEVLVPLSLLLAHAWRELVSRRAVAIALGVTIGFSTGMQVVGAFFSPCKWGAKPQWVHTHPERLWHWDDPETLRCLVAGLETGPAPFVFLERAR